MSPAQVKLLRQLIDAERDWHEARRQGLTARIPDRYVEVHGSMMKTAETLAMAGVAELEGREGRQLWARLA